MLSRRMQAASKSSAGWDLATAFFAGSPMNGTYVIAQESTPTQVAFKPDGTKMYVVGQATDTVYEYNLATAWDVVSKAYVQSYSVSAVLDPHGLFFKDDGTKMYVLDANSASLKEYSLSTAWNISTSSFVQSFSMLAFTGYGLFFKPDGTKLYTTRQGASATLDEYTLSTAWNISTASFTQSFSISTQTIQPRGVFFKSDGTRAYISSLQATSVFEYSLGTAWNTSTATYVQSTDVVARSVSPTGLSFKTDGTKLFIVDFYGTINQFSIGTAWNISTTSYTYPTTNYFSIVAQETFPSGITFKTDGTRMYVIGSQGDDINEYSLATAWDLTSATYTRAKVLGDTTPESIRFNDDGTKLYMVGSSQDRVYQYTLSTAWDVSTATFLQFFSVATQDTQPRGLWFKPDGSKMYVSGTQNNRVYEYSLSTAWDVSTSSFLQNVSVITNVSDLAFKPDGTQMFVVTQLKVRGYGLSTAWNISTAVFEEDFNTFLQSPNTSGIDFRTDGSKMYILDGAGDAVWSFNT